MDGLLTLRAVREGAICYLDEVVEARQDTTVVFHPLADYWRQLPIERSASRWTPRPDSAWWCPTTPDTRARLVTSRTPPASAWSPSNLASCSGSRGGIVRHEAGVDQTTAAQLVRPARPSAGWRPAGCGGRIDPGPDRGGRLGSPRASPCRTPPGLRSPAHSTDDSTVSRGLAEMIDVYLAPSEG